MKIRELPLAVTIGERDLKSDELFLVHFAPNVSRNVPLQHDTIVTERDTSMPEFGTPTEYAIGNKIASKQAFMREAKGFVNEGALWIRVWGDYELWGLRRLGEIDIVDGSFVNFRHTLVCEKIKLIPADELE